MTTSLREISVANASRMGATSGVMSYIRLLFAIGTMTGTGNVARFC